MKIFKLDSVTQTKYCRCIFDEKMAKIMKNINLKVNPNLQTRIFNEIILKQLTSIEFLLSSHTLEQKILEKISKIICATEFKDFPTTKAAIC